MSTNTQSTEKYEATEEEKSKLADLARRGRIGFEYKDPDEVTDADREQLATVLQRATVRADSPDHIRELADAADDEKLTVEELVEELADADDLGEAAVEAVREGRADKETAMEAVEILLDDEDDEEEDVGDEEPVELHGGNVGADGSKQRSAPETLDELKQRCEPTWAEVQAYKMGDRAAQIRLWAKRFRGEISPRGLPSESDLASVDSMEDVLQRGDDGEATLGDAFGMDPQRSSAMDDVEQRADDDEGTFGDAFGMAGTEAEGPTIRESLGLTEDA